MEILSVLSVVECRDLLETDTVGRVAFVTPFGPRIVPVNYALAGPDEPVIEFLTTIYSELARHAPGNQVAFEIDHLDGERRRGWSVVAHGFCTEIEDAPEGTSAEPSPWAGGERPVRLRLTWDQLTGRRVGGVHWPFPAVSGRGRRH